MFGAKAFHFTAFYAIEMGVRLVVGGGNNLLRTDGVGAVSDNFQDTQSIGSLPQTTMFNEVHIVTLIAHNLLPFSSSPDIS
jgi:hypothetical protein